MIKDKSYLKSNEIIDEFQSPLNQSIFNISDFSLNKKVKRNYPESLDYWVTEIKGKNILIRTTENLEDANYDDFWVNVDELRLV